MKMNPGDVVIVSGVTGMVLVTDIGINVPNGENTQIPGDLAYKSRELWDHISCNRIFWLNRPTNQHQFTPKPKPPPIIEPAPPAEPTVSNTHLQSELSRVQDESTKAHQALVEKIARLEAENARLKAESEKKSTEDDKLSTILERLNNLPTTTVQVVTQGQSTATTNIEPDAEEKVPIYIPSLSDARSIPSRITPKVIKTDGSDVEKASQALRKFRKQGG